MKVLTCHLEKKALDFAVFTALNLSYWLPQTARWDTNDPETNWILSKDGRLKKYHFDSGYSRAGTWIAHAVWNPSEDWSQGGPLRDAHHIDLVGFPHVFQGQILRWVKASMTDEFKFQNYVSRMGDPVDAIGPTGLVAAMRCLATAKLGLEVELPKEVLV
jgi:hypothetical protein